MATTMDEGCQRRANSGSRLLRRSEGTSHAHGILTCHKYFFAKLPVAPTNTTDTDGPVLEVQTPSTSDPELAPHEATMTRRARRRRCVDMSLPYFKFIVPSNMVSTRRLWRCVARCWHHLCMPTAQLLSLKYCTPLWSRAGTSGACTVRGQVCV